MPLYHCTAKMIGRGSGRSAAAASAYRAGEKLSDKRQGLEWDFTKRGGVSRAEIIAPEGAPAWAHDRQALWNAVEAREDQSKRHATAQTAREFEVSLPHELSREDREAAGLAFARYLVTTYGVAADVSFHDPHPGRNGQGQDERNFHVHILTTTRRVTAEGLGEKVRELDSKATATTHLRAVRAKWAEIANGYLERAGIEARLDHRSFKERGIEQEPTLHLGPAAHAMMKRGEASDRARINRSIEERNAAAARLRVEGQEAGAAIIDFQKERERRIEEQGRVEGAARARDPARVLDAVTERSSTFTRKDLNYALREEIGDARERAAFMDQVLSHGEAVPLRDAADGPVTRYTTRQVLRDERAILDAAARLDPRASPERAPDSPAGQAPDPVRPAARIDRIARDAGLNDEQRAALWHATGANGFAMIAGEAGTGKSRTLGAIRAAYEEQGFRVVGMAWTNAVVQDLRADGFKEATTIAAEMMRQGAGRSAWDSKTALVIDEAAMLSTRHLAGVMTRAAEAGAKVVLAGDDRQLASVERSGMFTALQEKHGAAELRQVQRTKDQDQARAFNLMHEGKFRPALQTFADKGMIHWRETQAEALQAAAERHAADAAAAPDKKVFVFAFTNADVDKLNELGRGLARQHGRLGEDVRLKTATGEKAFAVGDRIQFTGNGADKRAKALGLVNGAVGTVREISPSQPRTRSGAAQAQSERPEMAVELDTKAGDKPCLARFTVGDNKAAGEFNAIKHGYAGTIYRGQGKSLDSAIVVHSKHWRAASSYVALTRHRESVALFVGRDTAADLDDLARQMGRDDRKRAASGFVTAPAREPDEAARRQMEGGKQREETRADQPLKESREAARAAYLRARGGMTASGKESGGGGQTTGRPGGRGGGRGR